MFQKSWGVFFPEKKAPAGANNPLKACKINGYVNNEGLDNSGHFPAYIPPFGPFYGANSIENRPQSDEIGPGAWKSNKN